MGHTLVLNADWNPVSVLPLSTLNWQDAIKAVYLGTVAVVHAYENWVVNSPSCSFIVPSVVATVQHIKMRKVTGFSAEMIFLRDDYTCQYCEKTFTSRDLTLDHVIPKSHGGKFNTMNLVAACQSCNSRRGNNVRIQPKRQPYKATYYELAAKSRKYPLTVPHHSWIDHIGWDSKLVTIKQPLSEPGFQPMLEPREKLTKILIKS